MADGTARDSTRRAVPVLALAAAAVVVAYLVFLAPGASYTLHARFTDAGQLVRGDLVEVGGRRVGSITAITLTPNGQADLKLAIDDSSLVPLHEGTSATIREVGLVTITNRYVELDPGPSSAPALRRGGVLSTQHTFGIVDIDTLLDSLDAPTRAHLQQIFAQSARSLAPPTADELGRSLAFLDPALTQVSDLAREATSDTPALAAVLSNTASVSAALAARPDELTGAVRSTAAAIGELAAQRAALTDLLDRTPAVLGHAGRTLRSARRALGRLDPLLADLRPVAPRAAALLRRLVPVLADAAPTVTQVTALLPKATATLRALPATTRRALPAIRSSTRALAGVLPVLDGFLPYTPEVIAGFFNGFGGNSSGYYDANGHYARIALELGPGATFGLLSPAPAPALPGFGGYVTGQSARCPGGASEPAAAGANPWVVPGLCIPAQDHP